MPTTRPPGPRFGVSFAVLLLGGLAATIGVIALVSAFWSVLRGPAYQVPGTVRLHLDSGEYRVYELDRSGTGRSGPPLIDRSTVSVRAPGGAAVPVLETSRNETITNGTETFETVVRFDAPTAGAYTLRFTPAAPTRVMVEPPLEDIVRDHAGWLLLVGAGVLLAGIGFIMVVVGLVRRGSARKRSATVGVAAPATPTVSISPPPPTVAPAGWFPDPSGAHRLRYWDGRTWTEHIAD
jgi:hypothetical protein